MERLEFNQKESVGTQKNVETESYKYSHFQVCKKQKQNRTAGIKVKPVTEFDWFEEYMPAANKHYI